MGSCAKLRCLSYDDLFALLQPLTCQHVASKQLRMGLSGGAGGLMRTGFGVLATKAAQFGPSILARNDVGVRDMILGHG